MNIVETELMFNDNSFGHFIKTMKHFTEHENSCSIFVRMTIIFLLPPSSLSMCECNMFLDPKFMISANT